jgi:hypothetical protein
MSRAIVLTGAAVVLSVLAKRGRQNRSGGMQSNCYTDRAPVSTIARLISRSHHFVQGKRICFYAFPLGQDRCIRNIGMPDSSAAVLGESGLDFPF